MTPAIEIREIEPTHVASTRATTTPDQIAGTFAEKIHVVGLYVRDAGLTFVGPPYSRYFDFRPDRVEMEIGAAVESTAPGTDVVAVHDLPGGTAATVLHVCPYERLGETWDALLAWMASGEYEEAGPGWEVYITDPGEEPNPERWQTRIYWPIRRRGIVA